MSKRIKISDEKMRILETISICGLVVFALIAHFISTHYLNKNKDKISIFYEGQKVTELNGEKIDINVDGTFVFGDKNGEYNVIQIKDKKVSCIESNCPDQICVSHGELRSDIDNDMIVCAPHKLSIQYN